MKEISNVQKFRKPRAKRLARWLCFVGCVAGLAIVAGVGLIRIHAQDSFPLPAINPPGAKAAAPATGTAPTAQSAPQQAGPNASESSTPEVAKQCAQLLELATDLKAAVDKTSASTLSVTVVRKASEIEQFAHKVRNANAKN
jgi:type VI protein secretion system component VasF